MKNPSLVLSFIAIWAASLACIGTAPAVPTVDPNAAQTAIVETIVALEKQATPTASPTLAPPTSIPPIFTLTATETVVPFEPAPPTDTSSVPTISVTVATNCRLGPGVEFERVGMLLVGETTEIIGRDPLGQYWYVRNPDIGAPYCWLSGQYAIISGNAFALPLQPLPQGQALNFEAEYRGQGKCSGEFWANIRLNNPSRGTFKSIAIIATDQSTGDVYSYAGNEFSLRDDCAPARATGALEPSKALLISAPAFDYNMKWHDMSVSITLCTELNIGGQCVTKTLTYTP